MVSKTKDFIMNLGPISGGFLKGLLMGAVGVLVAPQLTLTYAAMQGAKYAAKESADAHNGTTTLAEA
ncbi:MAG: hypothetical protein HYR97_08840 [Candidatus Melainabacteria bacterium]|nr:hypothetical protein [Candidatus Melainabacteria bacterium]